MECTLRVASQQHHHHLNWKQGGEDGTEWPRHTSHDFVCWHASLHAFWHSLHCPFPATSSREWKHDVNHCSHQGATNPSPEPAVHDSNPTGTKIIPKCTPRKDFGQVRGR